MVRIFDPDVLDKLKDFDWFQLAVAEQYCMIARTYNCSLVMADDRMRQVHDFYLEEIKRAHDKNSDKLSLELDEFKHAAYLTFWLRRINPVREVRIIIKMGEREGWITSGGPAEPLQERFILYGNEICAFLAGLRLSMFGASSGLLDKTDETNVIRVWKDKSAIDVLDASQIHDFAMILKHKNISAHSLNMTFRMICRVGIQPHGAKP
jgi:hypothetical protein